MPDTGKTIIAVMNDLFFAAQIVDAGKKAGMVVEMVKDRAAAMEKARANPALVVMDLNYAAASPIELIRELKSDPATRGIRTVGFVSHVQTDIKLAAQDAGCDLVIARSAFAQRLPAILRDTPDCR